MTMNQCPEIDVSDTPIRMEKNRNTREWQVERYCPKPSPPKQPPNRRCPRTYIPPHPPERETRKSIKARKLMSEKFSDPGDKLVAVRSPCYGTFKARSQVVEEGKKKKRVKLLEPLPPIFSHKQHMKESQHEIDDMRTGFEEFERSLVELNSRRVHTTAVVGSRKTLLGRLKDTYAGNLLRSTDMISISKMYISVMGTHGRPMAEFDMRALFHRLVPQYPLGDEQMFTIFSIFDENGNGEVTFTELFGALGGILYGEDTQHGIRYFYERIECLGPLGGRRVPVNRFTHKHIDIIIKNFIPGNVAHRWFKLSDVLIETLQNNPIPENYIDCDNFICYVYHYPNLANCFHKIVPPKRVSHRGSK
eukprot:TRINITY_DN2671_c1_g1_i1.p1 TRINITY_DN2671_c1_g1~~TRINITY_DN2671_c1_g1_i1.p1  ORF type:complete len:362 (+),score=29.42 TRINITY_DN2671_c1_g1_i1:95-1180(+)